MALVTISRGTYTGGIAVAELLAAELGHPCVSREVVGDAARESGLDEEALRSTLEEPPHFWEKSPGKIAAHLNLMRVALLRRALHGSLVYHGYAGHLLLAGIGHVLRVRVVADTESRIRAAMADKGMDHREAAAFVKTLDVQLAKWTKFLYGVDWQDPLLYDVVVNLERLGVAGTVNTLIHMTRLDDFRPTDESRKAFDDLLLGSRVWAALSTDPRTRSANVRVAADGQMIFVTGMADNDRVATAVQEVAAGVDGVGRVNSEVGVGRNWSW